ncbi:MAG: hypothetical protein WDO15_11110 [Bacteroidota bacterium]
MNLANSYFHLNDTTSAMGAFQPLTMSTNPKLKSIANQQLGVLSNRKGNFEEALNYFKQSLRANPANDDARFNYEMVKKKLEEQKKKDQQNQDKNKDKQQKDEEQKEKQDKEQQQKDKEQQKDQGQERPAKQREAGSGKERSGRKRQERKRTEREG